MAEKKAAKKAPAKKKAAVKTVAMVRGDRVVEAPLEDVDNMVLNGWRRE